MRGRAWGLVAVGFALACSGGAPETPVSATSGVGAAPADAVAAEAPVDDPCPYKLNADYTREQLEKMTLSELALRRNVVFAHAGQPFRKKWLRDYFSQYAWYKPGAAVDMAKVSEKDVKNAALIAEVEASLSREQLLARKDELWAVEELVSTVGQPLDLAIEKRQISIALGRYAGDPNVPMAERNPLEDPTVLDQALVEAQLGDLSRRDLRLLRNTIFARHGRPFKSEVLQEYFGQKEWYAPDPDYTDKALTAVDQQNVALIVKVEESFGGMLSDAEHANENMTDAQAFFGA